MIAWSEYIEQNQGQECGLCLHHVWDYLSIRSYCRNAESCKYQQATDNHESCDQFHDRRKQGA